jgi:hypothetical protein
MKHQLLALDQQHYSRHRLHEQERDWAETNCYVDVWTELLHSWGLEPIAALPFTLAIDFEGDQWTFFKFPSADLLELYNLDVQEMAVWRPMTAHIEEHLTLGRPLLIELDSYYLPDTAGTAYRTEHVKTTVGVVAIDVAEQTLGYFHGQGYYHLSGEDFAGVFYLNGEKNPAILPPYVEIVKRLKSAPLRGSELLEASLNLLNKYLQRLPETNPFVNYKPRFAADVQWLGQESLATFHQYSFATLRQFGACYEVGGVYLKWLQAQGITNLEVPIASLQALSTSAKGLQFQLARAQARKKPLDSVAIDTMAAHWQTAMDHLKSKFL